MGNKYETPATHHFRYGHAEVLFGHAVNAVTMTGDELAELLPREILMQDEPRGIGGGALPNMSIIAGGLRRADDMEMHCVAAGADGGEDVNIFVEFFFR